MTNLVRELYSYEVETSRGTLHTKDNNFNPDEVVRVSFIPKSKLLPRHDITMSDGVRFAKRFARVLLNFRGIPRECIHCVITDRFRFYLLSSSGRVLITHKDYELYF